MTESEVEEFNKIINDMRKQIELNIQAMIDCLEQLNSIGSEE